MAKSDIEIGKELYDKQEYEQAAAAFTKVIKNGNADGDGYYFRAGCYMELKKYEQAIADLTKVLEKDNNNLACILVRAMCYKELKKYEPAIADFTKRIEAIDEYRDREFYFDLHFLRGSCYFELGKHDEAVTDYTKAIEHGIDELGMFDLEECKAALEQCKKAKAAGAVCLGCGKPA